MRWCSTKGIGLVLGYADDMTAVALGKGGQRNLHTGEVVGADPVAPYAPAAGHGAASIEKRVWQLRRVMDFKHAGDLWADQHLSIPTARWPRWKS
jgi:hypothetical protein